MTPSLALKVLNENDCIAYTYINNEVFDACLFFV